MVRRRRFIPLAASAALLAAWPSPPRPPRAAGGRDAATAPGRPGRRPTSTWRARTASAPRGDTSSKVWYTVADGVLSDVYEPTIDNTNVETLQYVVTDGATFTDLQTRDMTYTVAADPTGMECTVTSTDAKHGFQLVTTYITDPHRDTVLMNTRLQACQGPAPTWPGCSSTPGSTRTSTATAAAGARTPAATPAWSTRHGHPGGLQHQHGHQGGQPQLRGADLHGDDHHLRGRGLGRLRGHRQRRADPARYRAHPDAVHLRRRRPHRGHRERHPGRAAAR